MKAVIMAGGKGTRLRPLTSRLPKPMVPLLDKPCMEYIIELLKRHGIEEIAVTVQYLPQAIQNHFGDGSDYGVKIQYFEETLPLGTAGSVKNAEDFLDDTFIVISGDALTDFDLDKAVAFHRERRAIGTLVTTRVEVPLEYGVVMTDESGRILRFLEKPNWSEVFSDTVNTGIYVLEPEILSFFHSGESFDFSKDLFPLIMAKNLPLYGYIAEGYWSDIGSLRQYRKTQMDMLEGRVKVSIPGTEVEPHIWVGEGVEVEDTSSIQAPVFIGAGTKVSLQAKVGPYAVLGRYNRIASGARVDRSILWNRTSLGAASSLSGSTLTHDVRVAEGARIGEDTVVGDRSLIGETAVVEAGVKVYPGKTVGPGCILKHSLVWGASVSRGIFGSDGVSGITNLDLTPERAGGIVSAYASVLPPQSVVVVSSDDAVYSQILKYAILSSLLASGIHVRDLGTAPAPVVRHACRREKQQGGIHLRRSNESAGSRTVLQFFDREGLPIDKGTERKIEHAWMQEEYARPTEKSCGIVERWGGAVEAYQREVMSRINVLAVREREFRLVFHSENTPFFPVIQPLLEQLGCQVVTVLGQCPALDRFVLDNRADLGIQMDGSGQSLSLFTEKGYRVSHSELTVLQTLLAILKQERVAIPVTAPSAAEMVARNAGVEPVRTKDGVRAVLEVDRTSSLQVYFDGFYTLACLLEYVAVEKITLQEALKRLPPIHLSRKKAGCPIEAKGRVMRKLMQEMKGRDLELLDGIRVLTEAGWVLILPDAEKAHFEVVAQGKTSREAEAQVRDFQEKIERYQSPYASQS
ncbi:sugar phosphate nucleotidyltransferase [Salinithrix halophila]|uniref:Sugar phosphate nucleotidyltransferase n=1 Tax=Salinithrix halophila TaxID=1485204 RepID=A0ABV8JID9_9BACL